MIYYKQKDNLNITDTKFKYFHLLHNQIDEITNRGPFIFELIKIQIKHDDCIINDIEVKKSIFIYSIPEELEYIFINKYNKLFGFQTINVDDFEDSMIENCQYIPLLKPRISHQEWRY